MSQTPQGKNFKTAQTPGTGRSSKGSRNEGSQPESAKNSRSGKVNSFAQVVKMYVPKTPKGSETPAGLNTKPEASFTGAQEDFTSPAVIKAANNFVALRKPNKKKGSARMVLQKVYHSKSIDLNKEEAKKEDEDKQKEEDDGEIRERATVGDRYRGEEEEDETMLQYRHSLPAHLTCPTEIEGRGTVESPTGNYEFKDEAVDENEVVRLVGTDNQKETAQKEERTSHIEQTKEQIGGAENIICSPLDVPDNKLGDEVQDQVQEEGGQTQQEKDVKKEEADVDVLEEEQVGQGDIGRQENEALRTEEEQLEGEHLNTISEEREGHEEEEILQQAREQKEIPETGAIQEYHSQQEHNLSKDQSLSSSIQDNTAFSEERSARDRRVSETTSKAETASTPANETYISQRNDDAQETFKERTGSSGFEIQAGSRAQGEVVKKSARPPTEFREREIQEVEVRRQVEEAPKQKRNIPPRHEETEKPEIKTETPGDRKGSGHPVDSREHKTPAGVSDIDVKKEMQRQSEQKKFQEDLTSKLEKVQTIDELAIDEKSRKGREGCCQAGCSMF